MRSRGTIGWFFAAVGGLIAGAFGAAWVIGPPAPQRGRGRSRRLARSAASKALGTARRAAVLAARVPTRRPAQHAGRRARAWGVLIVLALLAGGVIWFYVARSTAQDNKKAAMELTGGDPDRGKAAIEAYGCASCHTIPGIRGADAQVGPPLTQVGGRMYIGGVLSNTPENMILWLRDPPGVDPKTAMPNLNVSERGRAGHCRVSVHAKVTGRGCRFRGPRRR